MSVTLTPGIQDTIGTPILPYTWSFTIGVSSCTGVFEQPVPLGTGGMVAITGDFDGDGDLDLIALTGLSTLLIFENDGSGNFTQISSLYVTDIIGDFKMGDIDGDGDIDLLPEPGNGNVVFILKNDGTGNFTQTTTPSFSNGNGIGLGDFDGDGDLYLSVSGTGWGGLMILKNDGDGNFTWVSTVNIGSLWPQGQTETDLDGDGDLDIAIVKTGSNNVAIVKNDGTGNFTLASTPSVGREPRIISSGYFDSDGHLDLAVGNTPYRGMHSVSILINDGTGSFTQTAVINVGMDNGGGLSSIAIGDLHRDGDLDLVVTYIPSNTVSIIKNTGTSVSVDTDSDSYSDNQDCDPNNLSIHPNATELCNNIDDDCDDQTDETFTDKVNICYGYNTIGDMVCNQDGSGTVCNAGSQPSLEVCDGVDNDCDGVVDDNCGEFVTGPFTIRADIIQFQGNGKYLASGNVRLSEFLHMPDNLLIDLSDPDNPWIEGNGVVSIGLPWPEMAIFAGAFYLDAETQKLRPQAGIILEPRLFIAGFEISIDEIEIVADIAPDSDPQNDAGVIINGSFTLPTIFWKSKNDKIDISFKRGLSIGILSGLHFSYGYQIEGLKFGNTGWELKDLYFFYNTATDTIEAKTELKLPVFRIEATLALKGGTLDSIILDVDLSRLPTPIVIDSLPLILSRIAGGVENIQRPDPIRIRAGTGVQTYP